MLRSAERGGNFRFVGHGGVLHGAITLPDVSHFSHVARGALASIWRAGTIDAKGSRRSKPPGLSLHQKQDDEKRQLQRESRIHFYRQFEHGVSLDQRWRGPANLLKVGEFVSRLARR